MGFWNSLGKAADKTYSTTMTIAEAIQQWVKENPREATWFNQNNIKIDADVLKDEKYRDVRFDAGMPKGQTACKIVNGTFCDTVGEYQDALKKFSDGYHDGHNYGNAMQDDNRY